MRSEDLKKLAKEVYIIPMDPPGTFVLSPSVTVLGKKSGRPYSIDAIDVDGPCPQHVHDENWGWMSVDNFTLP